MSNSVALIEALERLYRLHPLKIDLSLGRLNRLLKALGNPEKKLPPVIHVAGTNGKGSVVANLRAILEAANLKVHVYTSPHLVRFNERIRLTGKLIEDDYLIEVLDRVEAANQEKQITFFEVTTAAAFVAFSEVLADVCILEVGLGGRLDATNVIDKPHVSVITPVGYDHAEFLGDDLGIIAQEKAGIAKKGVPLVVAKQAPEAQGAIEKYATKVGANLVLEGRDWDILGRDCTGFGKKLTLPNSPLAGGHQIHNAGLAVAALMTQNTFEISLDAIQEGLQNTSWPARFQKLSPTDFPTPLPEGADIWLDGGHNPLAGQALAKVFATVQAKDRPRILIVGMMANKDVRGFLKPLAPHFEKFFAVPIPGQENCASPEELCRVAKGLSLDACKAESVEAALGKINAADAQILITGSLYLAGYVLGIINYQIL